MRSLLRRRDPWWGDGEGARRRRRRERLVAVVAFVASVGAVVGSAAAWAVRLGAARALGLPFG